MRRGNSPGDDESRPVVGSGNSSSSLSGLTQSTERTGNLPTRRTEPVNVWAYGYLVVGTRGRLALTMIVLRCVFCGRPHRHNGRPDFASGRRTASCGRGRYVVHLGTLEGQVAA